MTWLINGLLIAIVGSTFNKIVETLTNDIDILNTLPSLVIRNTISEKDLVCCVQISKQLACLTICRNSFPSEKLTVWFSH